MKLPSRRLGKFAISSFYISTMFDEVKWLLSKVTVLEAKYDVSRDAFVYTAISDAFDEVPGHVVPLWYDVVTRIDYLEPGHGVYRIVGFRCGLEDKIRTWGR